MFTSAVFSFSKRNAVKHLGWSSQANVAWIRRDLVYAGEETRIDVSFVGKQRESGHERRAVKIYEPVYLSSQCEKLKHRSFG